MSNVNTTAPVPPDTGPPNAVHVIRLVCIPIWTILLIFGLLGNVLTVVVLRARRFQGSSTSLYLTVLAITDILYLLTSLSHSIINYIFLFPSEVRQLSAPLCFLTPYLHYTLAYISVWLLVTVTVERAIWVVLPFRARHICTRRNSLITVFLLVAAFAVLDVHFFFTLAYAEVRPGRFACVPNKFDKTQFAGKVFPFVDLLFVAVFPCFIMMVANVLIGWKLRTMRNFRKGAKAVVPRENTTLMPKNGTTTAGETEEIMVDESPENGNTVVVQSAGTPAAKQCADTKSINLTRMLVSTNIFFIVSVTPLLVYDVVFFTVDVQTWAKADEAFRGTLLFALERLVYTLWYTNFAIHFLLYCLGGPPFREETIALFRRMRKGWCQHR